MCPQQPPAPAPLHLDIFFCHLNSPKEKSNKLSLMDDKTCFSMIFCTKMFAQESTIYFLSIIRINFTKLFRGTMSHLLWLWILQSNEISMWNPIFNLSIAYRIIMNLYRIKHKLLFHLFCYFVLKTMLRNSWRRWGFCASVLIAKPRFHGGCGSCKNKRNAKRAEILVLCKGRRRPFPFVTLSFNILPCHYRLVEGDKASVFESRNTGPT